jgi:hypothetical protein
VLDIMLLLCALPAARHAQRVADMPLPALVAAMAGGMPAPTADASRIALAAARATHRWARWFGGLDSCLTRSLATGAMLAGRAEVVLHVGFRPGEQQRVVDGHAWVTVDGTPVGADADMADEHYTRVLSIPFQTAAGGRS